MNRMNRMNRKTFDNINNINNNIKISRILVRDRSYFFKINHMTEKLNHIM